MNVYSQRPCRMAIMEESERSVCVSRCPSMNSLPALNPCVGHIPGNLSMLWKGERKGFLRSSIRLLLRHISYIELIFHFPGPKGSIQNKNYSMHWSNPDPASWLIWASIYCSGNTDLEQANKGWRTRCADHMSHLNWLDDLSPLSADKSNNNLFLTAPKGATPVS